MIFVIKRRGGEEGDRDVRLLGVQSWSRCLLAAVLCGSPAVVCRFSMSNAAEL